MFNKFTEDYGPPIIGMLVFFLFICLCNRAATMATDLPQAVFQMGMP